MKTRFQVLPSLAFAALAAALPGCGPASSGTVTVELDAPPQWDGSTEALVHHADGVQVSRAPITGPSAAVAIDEGDTVTVAIHRGQKTELRSFTEVGAGDVIRVKADLFAQATAPVAVHVPTAPGEEWWAWTPSDGGSSNTPTLTVAAPAGRTSLPVIAAAVTHDPTHGATIAAVYADKAASVTATGIDLHQTAPWKMVTVRGEHAPAGAAVFDAAEIVLGRDTVPVQIVDVAGLPIPTGFGDAVRVAAITSSPTEFFVAASTSADVPDSPVTLDLAVPSLPVITDLTVSLADHHAGWTATGGGDYDAAMLTFSPNAPADGAYWVITAPAGVTLLTLPTLPADLTPPAAVAYIVTATSDTGIDGYDAWLAQPPPAAGSLLQVRDTFVLAAGVTTR